jgi:hypothetical protein
MVKYLHGKVLYPYALKALLHGAIFHATCLAMFKKNFDNALQEVLHAAMIFMQLATIGDRGMRRD